MMRTALYSHPPSRFAATVVRRWTLAELSGWETSLPLDARGRDLGDLLLAEPDLPGVLLESGNHVRGAISRRAYLDLIGRYCGMDLYHPRPLRLMVERIEKERGPALVLDAELSIEEAVRLGLERPRELAYEPIVVRCDDLVWLVDFETVLLAHTERTIERNEQMRQILATVREGLVVLDRDGRIGAETSRSAREILGGDPAGRSLREVVAELAGPERAELAEGYLEPLFSPRVAENLIGQINPIREIETADGRVLATRFVRGTVEGRIQHALLHIADLTAERAMAARVAAERERAEERVELALALVGAEGPAVRSLLVAVEGCREALETQRRTRQPLGTEGKRLLHRLKGEAAMLGLDAVATLAHDLESDAAADRPPRAGVAERLSELAASVRSVVDRLATWASPVAAPGLEGAPAAEGEALGDEWHDRARRLVDRVARDQHKRVELNLDVPSGPLASEFLDLLRIAVPQLLRNAVVHGIEEPAQRIAAGKPPVGRIDLEIQRRDGWIELVVQDDGRGLDLVRLQRSGIERGVPAELLSNPRELIFASGVSTADDPDEHAGRGVGLDLVRAEARARGGEAEVYGEPGGWSAFRVVVPA